MMFKDATNATATYGSRIMTVHAVKNGEFTVLDFNLARNPPCAYSPYTVCPLPPAENRLAVAIEAGEKRFPTDNAFPCSNGGSGLALSRRVCVELCRNRGDG
jgi:uncharacterized protein (DUF1684 family)